MTEIAGKQPLRDASMGDDLPIEPVEFAYAMQSLGPFERAPLIVVAVSGGPDSTALAHLTAFWTKARRGRVVAVVVDHRLRDGSTAEAGAVAASLRDAGLEAIVRTLDGDPPKSAVHVHARSARYRLLAETAVQIGALHVLTGHHTDDQAETVRMRARRDSGADGLAGMAAIRELRGVRLLRPLLGFTKARLIATCRSRGLSFVVDPSNGDPRFERSRMRCGIGEYAEVLQSVPAPECPAPREASPAGVARSSREQTTTAWLALYTTFVASAGFALDRTAWEAAGPWLRRAVVARALMTCGRLTYPPPPDAQDRLVSALASAGFRPRTLGRCIIERTTRRIVIRPEPASQRRSTHASVEPAATLAPVTFVPHVLASRQRSLMYDARGWAFRARPVSDPPAEAGLGTETLDGPCHNEAPG